MTDKSAKKMSHFESLGHALLLIKQKNLESLLGISNSRFMKNYES